jgi:hypothetical protein
MSISLVKRELSGSFPLSPLWTMAQHETTHFQDDHSLHGNIELSTMFLEALQFKWHLQTALRRTTYIANSRPNKPSLWFVFQKCRDFSCWICLALDICTSDAINWVGKKSIVAWCSQRRPLRGDICLCHTTINDKVLSGVIISSTQEIELYKLPVH